MRSYPGVIGRLGLVVVLTIGVGMAGFSLAAELPAKTQGADAVLDSFRPLYEPEALRKRIEDVAGLQAMAAELSGTTIPALAEAASVTPEQLQVSLESASPGMAQRISDLGALAGAHALFGKGLELTGGNYALSDQVPTSFLPSTAVHYIFLISGLMLAAIGALGLAVPRLARGMLWLAFINGVTFPLVALALQFPAKTQAVDELTEAFRGLMTTPVATTIRGQLESVRGIETELVPALAGAANLPTGQVESIIGSNSPAVQNGISALPAVIPDLEVLTVAIESNVDNFRRADSLPIESQPTTTMHWLFVYPGLLLALAGAVGLTVPWWRGVRAPEVSRSFSGLATT